MLPWPAAVSVVVLRQAGGRPLFFIDFTPRGDLSALSPALMTNPRASAFLAGSSGCEFIEMCTFKCTASGGSLAIPKVELSKAVNL
jgi:hypothetical protein